MVFNYIAVLVLARAMMVAQGDHGGQSTSLHDKYSFSMVLNHDPSYVLHWSVDVTSREVSFAVNASSRGWVGLGISKTGQMIGSDVATAWIDDIGKAQLQVTRTIAIWGIQSIYRWATIWRQLYYSCCI